MGWMDVVKGLFRTTPPSEGVGEHSRFIPAADNPYGVDLWDCAAFTQSRISGSEDPAVASCFVRLRSSTGEEHRGKAPANASVIECALHYVREGDVTDGPLFKAREMEDKWDLYVFGPHLYFARSWTGELVYRATIRLEPSRLEITRIESAGGQHPEYSRRSVDYLVKSHVFGAVVPHPLPQELPADPMQIAAFSFATFGRRCLYGTYADTTGWTK